MKYLYLLLALSVSWWPAVKSDEVQPTFLYTADDERNTDVSSLNTELEPLIMDTDNETTIITSSFDQPERVIPTSEKSYQFDEDELNSTEIMPTPLTGDQSTASRRNIVHSTVYTSATELTPPEGTTEPRNHDLFHEPVAPLPTPMDPESITTVNFDLTRGTLTPVPIIEPINLTTLTEEDPSRGPITTIPIIEPINPTTLGQQDRSHGTITTIPIIEPIDPTTLGQQDRSHGTITTIPIIEPIDPTTLGQQDTTRGRITTIPIIEPTTLGQQDPTRGTISTIPIIEPIAPTTSTDIIFTTARGTLTPIPIIEPIDSTSAKQSDLDSTTEGLVNRQTTKMGETDHSVTALTDHSSTTVRRVENVTSSSSGTTADKGGQDQKDETPKINDFTKDENDNLITIIVVTQREWNEETEEELKNFVAKYVNEYLHDFKNNLTRLDELTGTKNRNGNLSRNTALVKKNEIFIVNQATFHDPEELAITLYVDNPARLGDSDHLPAYLVVNGLRKQSHLLANLLQGNVTDIYQGLGKRQMKKEKKFEPEKDYFLFNTKYEKLIISLIGVIGACLIIVLIAILWVRCSRLGFYEGYNLERERLKEVGMKRSSFDGKDLTPASEILQEERDQNGGYLSVSDQNNKKVTLTITPDDGWVVPFKDVPLNDKITLPCQDTKL